MAHTQMANDVYISSIPAVANENDRAILQDRIVDAKSVMGLVAGNASGNITLNNGTLNINCNVEKLGGNLASAFATTGHTHTAVTTSSNGLMSNTDKTKLDTISTSAEVNQMAFSNILINGVTIQADSKTDTLEFVAGTNIALTPDATNDKVTIAVAGTVASATTSATCTGNAVTAGGLAVTIGRNNVANQIVRTDGSGYLQVGYINSNSGNEGNNSNPNRVWGTNGSDDYLRTYLTSALNVNYANSSGYATSAGSAPANGGTSSACSGNASTSDWTKRLNANTHGLGTYNVQPDWTGVYWRLRGYSGDTYHSPVQVGYADSAGNADTLDGYHASALMGGFDTAHSFSTNGYQKLSNGLVLQWGEYISGVNPQAITFPIAFPTACLRIIAQTEHVGQASNAIAVKVGSKTTTGFQMYVGETNILRTWFAIGY